MVLASTHPGVTVEEVRAETGWPLRVAPDVGETAPPSADELAVIRRFDPEGFWTGGPGVTAAASGGRARGAADVVVIGSGGFGAATAYFLMRRGGGRRVVLLDRHDLASQTSPRAAGNAAVLRSTELMTRLAGRAVEWLLRLQPRHRRSPSRSSSRGA